GPGDCGLGAAVHRTRHGERRWPGCRSRPIARLVAQGAVSETPASKASREVAAMFTRLRQDLCAAPRRILRRPALFAATTSITALALGAVLAMAILLDAIAYRPIPAVNDPSSLAYLQLTRDATVHSNLPLASVRALGPRQHSFSATCAFSAG